MNRIKLYLFITAFISNIAFAEGIRIDDNNAFFLYESRADIKASEENLASFMSVEYRAARDEFTKRDLFNKIKPVLDKKMKEASAQDTVTLNVNAKLGEYNFDLNAFKTGLSENTYIEFDFGYGVIFDNAKSIKHLPVSFDSAKSLAPALGNSRSATYHLTAEILTVKEDTINYRPKKLIVLKITNMSVKLKSGENVGSISF